MCGICGLISNEVTSFDIEKVRAMNNQMINRGPDGEGFYFNDCVALAMRRLSIIDLTTGWQPLYNEDHSLVLVFNGEIYNYIELRANLEKAGHVLDTKSDGETILHLYEDYGLDFVQYLRGMFAIALWDKNQRRLIIARDRMGEKPLYFFINKKSLIFASELKAILKSGLIDFKLNPIAIDLYFHYGYIPEPLTPIYGVKKLDAGHILEISTTPWEIKDHTYWRMEDAEPIEGNASDIIRKKLDEISEIVIRSDVPVGVALSGGIDSGAIATLASRKYPGAMQTFSVGYPGHPPCDEREQARALAKELNIPVHDVELRAEDLVSIFPKLVYWRDDPIADISGYGYYALSKAAHEANVPVLLQGQGGDELFWGYGWVKEAVELTMLKKRVTEGFDIPAFLKLLMKEPNLKSMFKRLISNPRFLYSLLERNRSQKANSFYFMQITPDFNQATGYARNIYGSDFSEQISSQTPFDIFSFTHPWEDIEIKMTKLICDTYLRENGIAQADRLSMASSVELRLPLVDYQLVETIIGLRKSSPDSHLPLKAILKEALQGILSNEVLNRPKRGFSPPTHEWYNGLFATYGSQVADGLLVEKGVLNIKAAKQLSKGIPYTGVHPISFKALVLEMWYRSMQ